MRTKAYYAVVTFLMFLTRYEYIQAADDKLVPLRSFCTNSVQCIGVAVCIDNKCRCPHSYTAIGSTCVHSGFENGLGSDHVELLSLEKYTIAKEGEGGLASSEFLRIGSSLLTDKRSSIILDKIGSSTSSPSSAGYPGQPCGQGDECRGNSFCYKGVCSCHPGAIVAGRICATIKPAAKPSRPTSSTLAPKPKGAASPKPISQIETSLEIDHVCQPPSILDDGICVTTANDVPSIPQKSTKVQAYSAPEISTGLCVPPLVAVDGWCMLPVSLAAPANRRNNKESTQASPSVPTQKCPSPSLWLGGRCISPPDVSIPSAFVTPLISPPLPNLPLPGFDAGAPVDIAASGSVRRCPAGEILINSACLSTAVVVNYPSPLLCRIATDCPGGSTCLGHFCVCPAPFVWHSKLGCGAPPLAPPSIDTTAAQTVLNIPESEMTLARNFQVQLDNRQPATNGVVPLGGRCQRDSECIERAACELNICACRVPYMPYFSMCIFAPTEEEIQSAIP